MAESKPWRLETRLPDEDWKVVANFTSHDRAREELSRRSKVYHGQYWRTTKGDEVLEDGEAHRDEVVTD